MGGILAGIEDILGRHLGVANVRTRSTCNKLSDAPPPGFDAASLIEDILARIETNKLASNGAKKRSAQNWRFEKQLKIAETNSSPEKTLEKAMARLTGDDWANQVPTASGLVNGTNDRHRNLDLVFRVSRDRFEFIELKVDSDTPLYAAMEVLQYGILYLAWRLNGWQTEARGTPLLAAKTVHLRVLAPLAYYRNFQLDWLERALTAGLQTAIAKRPSLPAMDFKFVAFTDSFDWPCPDHALLGALEGRRPVQWAKDVEPVQPNEANAAMMKDRQLAWALGGGIPVAALEERRGQPSWVLKPQHRKRNMFRPEWWDHIAGAEHRWARALNSSQCFAVNLFAPLAEDPARARTALKLLVPERDLDAQDTVAVKFEFTPEGAAKWLGERGQSTQIDVYFEILRSGRCFAHVLVEVKFSETSFGCCRGWKTKKDSTSSNPDRSRCLDVSAVQTSPRETCWLAEVEGRHYWEIMAQPSSSIRTDAVTRAGACPFRHGLYQMMRNRVLADELVRRTGAEWADFAVCRHAANSAVVVLEEPVYSTSNAIEAFRALSSHDAVRDWNAEEVLRTIRATDDRLAEWEMWMRGRYFG
jgi:hypothetical protein